MKIFVAQSTVRSVAMAEGHRARLGASLEAAGHQLQWLDLPSVAAAGRTLTNIASYRLLTSAETADALICLDAVAAVLPHPRKLVVLLDDTYLAADESELPDERPFDRKYIGDVLRSGIADADEIFAVSRFAVQRLQALSINRTQLVLSQPTPLPSPFVRNPGPEVLVLSPLSERQRPELLIACLAALPHPFRARWIAPFAQPAALARLRELAQRSDVQDRLAIDVRDIGQGERAYLLAHASALLILAPGVLAVSQSAYEAVHVGLPVVVCTDGGALTEIADLAATRLAKPVGIALAEAVREACAVAAVKPWRNAPVARNRLGPWAPLLKALSA